ncbi:MAG TPA: DedA family protein/thiosulfate sulfurtransferase GlpE [Nitrospiraceae bacterium]|nr:DedA family protein/thiosulfate sulfurtransferase GlpE [Nitrospiraceae bacterium]
MNEANAFVAQYGEILLFAVVFAEQIGMPLPAVPILLAAGALSGAGKIDLTGAIILSVIACLAGDLIWYELGRRRGRRALNLLCRISLEPDSCVRRTENFFTRHGVGSLVLAKFIPGLSTLAPALAGLFRIRMQRFLLYNGLGAILWTLAFVLPGYLLSDQIERLAEEAERLGLWLAFFFGGGIAAYLICKFVHRQLLLRELRIARITADELKRMMDNGRELLVVDLRGALDHEADPYTIRGALRMTAEELAQRHHEIPRDQDVILFCSCPNEATAAKMALMLRSKGVTRVRPLVGGIDAWREKAFPLEASRAVEVSTLTETS